MDAAIWYRVLSSNSVTGWGSSVLSQDGVEKNSCYYFRVFFSPFVFSFLRNFIWASDGIRDGNRSGRPAPVTGRVGLLVGSGRDRCVTGRPHKK